MADRPLKLRELRKILARYGITEDKSRGKGSHTIFVQDKDDGKRVFTIPTTKKDVDTPYIRSLRTKFGLRKEDGVNDDEFYGKG